MMKAKQQATSNKQQATSNKQQATNNKQTITRAKSLRMYYVSSVQKSVVRSCSLISWKEGLESSSFRRQYVVQQNKQYGLETCGMGCDN
jgi:hypothetical protein